MSNMKNGSSILNFQCFVLCLKNIMPLNAPTPPIKNAETSNALSLMRRFLSIAFCLSAPYRMKINIFHELFLFSDNFYKHPLTPHAVKLGTEYSSPCAEVELAVVTALRMPRAVFMLPVP